LRRGRVRRCQRKVVGLDGPLHRHQVTRHEFAQALWQRAKLIQGSPVKLISRDLIGNMWIAHQGAIIANGVTISPAPTTL
jgi:hypothetical protein